MEYKALLTIGIAVVATDSLILITSPTIHGITLIVTVFGLVGGFACVVLGLLRRRKSKHPMDPLHRDNSPQNRD
jgi:hypothetical protein